MLILTRRLPATPPLARTVAAAAIAVGLAGCSGGPASSCDDIDFSQFDNEVIVTGISTVDAFRRTDDGVREVADENATVALENLELHVTMEFVRQRRGSATATASAGFGVLDWLVSSAQACSLPAYEGDIESTVTDVDLISNAPLGPQFDAGRSLQNIFLIEGARVEGINYGDFYEDFSVPMQDYGQGGPVVASVKYVLVAQAASPLADSPVETDFHQFTFSISLETGEMFTSMSDTILVSF